MTPAKTSLASSARSSTKQCSFICRLRSKELIDVPVGCSTNSNVTLGGAIACCAWGAGLGLCQVSRGEHVFLCLIALVSSACRLGYCSPELERSSSSERATFLRPRSQRPYGHQRRTPSENRQSPIGALRCQIGGSEPGNISILPQPGAWVAQLCRTFGGPSLTRCRPRWGRVLFICRQLE